MWKTPGFKLTERGGAPSSDWSDFHHHLLTEEDKTKGLRIQNNNYIKNMAVRGKRYIFIQNLKQSLCLHFAEMY